MPLTKETRLLDLDLRQVTQIKPNLLQGAEDIEFVITLTKNGVEQNVSDGAKVTLSVIHPQSNTQTCGQPVTNPTGFVIAPGDTGYNITVSGGKITLPIIEQMVSASGLNSLVLHVDDGVKTYSYKAEVEIDSNPAYTGTSTADNLPTYQKVKEQVDQNTTDISTNKANIQTNTQDLSNTKSELQSAVNDIKSNDADISNNRKDIDTNSATIQQHTIDISNKAESDLSNVGQFAAAEEGSMFYKKAGQLVKAPIAVNDGEKKIETSYSLQTAPSSVYLGPNLSLTQNGGFVENHTVTLDKYYLMLDQENDRNAGSSRPMSYPRGAKQSKVVIQARDNVVMRNVTSAHLGNSADDHQTQAVYFKLINPVTNLKLQLVVNGSPAMDYPYGGWNNTDVAGYNLGANLQKVDLQPFWSTLKEYDITLNFKADNQIDMLGNGTIPYYEIDMNPIERKQIPYMEDLIQNETAQEIARKLETLIGDDRLDIESLKGVGDLINGPRVRNALETLTGEDRLDANYIKNLPDSGGTVTPDYNQIVFKKVFGIEAVNKSGKTIPANRFVFLAPNKDGGFDMELITRSTGYKGELFGYLRAETTNNNKNVVELVTVIPTGETAVSEGVKTVVGFDTALSDSVTLAKQGDLDLEFGVCGVFGEQNDIGEYIAYFNAFEVQSTYWANLEKSNFKYEPTSAPWAFDETADGYYVDLTIGGNGETIFQMLPELSKIKQGYTIYLKINTINQLNKITLTPTGTDKINGNNTPLSFTGSGFHILISTDEGWRILELSSGGSTDTQVAINKTNIEKNTQEIERLKTDISDNTLPTYVFRDRGVPVIPTDKQYKAYYIHSLVLRDSTSVIDIPQNAPDGAILSIENNDRTDYLGLIPAAGETINGSASTYQCGHDTLNYFVKDKTDWKLVYGGVFPNSYDSLKSTIQTLFPNSLHTLAEVEAQLKDRLHTFREIQTEFNDQLHTFDAIEADMTNRGFRKKGGRAGFQGDQAVPTDINSWSIKDFAANEEFLLPAQNKGNQYILFSLPTDSASIVGEIYINQAVMEFEQHKLVDNELDYKVFISSSPVDTSVAIRFKIDYIDHSEGHGVEIDDGVTNKAGIKKINVTGAYLSKVYDDSDEVDLKMVTSFETLDGMGGGRVNRVLVEEPLLTVLDPNTNPGEEDRIKLYLQHDYFELAKPPGYLAYLTENEEVIGRIKPSEVGIRVGTIWFDDVIVGGDSPFIEIDKPNKALGVQDYTGDDPNVTGGVPTLIVFRIAMKGTAPNDGFVEILLKKTDEGTPIQNGEYLLNANGNPIGVRKQYKAGDDLGYLEAAAIYMAKGITKFQCLIEHDFVDDGVMIEDRTEGASGILIQALGENYATGDALLQFENDTMQNIEMTKHYNGEDIFNMAWALSYNRNDVDINAGNGQTTVDGLHFYNNTNLKIGIADKTIHIHDNGSDMAYFSLGQIFSAEKTYMLRNKDLDIKVTLQDKQNGYRIYMVKWTGLPDKYTTKIIDHSDADAGAITENNWTLDGSIFISEDAVSGEHDFQGVLTVPADAVNFAVVIVPIMEQIPIDLYMKAFEINVSEPFYGWILKSPELIDEKHLAFDEKHAELRCDVAGYASIRYTLNNVSAGMPMPIGVIKNGKADIEIDHTINQVSGSQLPQFEGAIKFLKEGKATIQTELYVHSEKADSVLATTKFWYSKVSQDGQTFTKIPLSEYTTQVRGQTKAINRMPKFVIDVQPGDRIALFGTSDQADGAFIDQNAGDATPMLKTVINFDEVTTEESDLLDRMTQLELHGEEIEFVKDGKVVTGYKLVYDVDTSKMTIEEVK